MKDKMPSYSGGKGRIGTTTCEVHPICLVNRSLGHCRCWVLILAGRHLFVLFSHLTCEPLRSTFIFSKSDFDLANWESGHRHSTTAGPWVRYFQTIFADATSQDSDPEVNMRRKQSSFTKLALFVHSSRQLCLYSSQNTQSVIIRTIPSLVKLLCLSPPLSMIT